MKDGKKGRILGWGNNQPCWQGDHIIDGSISVLPNERHDNSTCGVTFGCSSLSPKKMPEGRRIPWNMPGLEYAENIENSLQYHKVSFFLIYTCVKFYGYGFLSCNVD